MMEMVACSLSSVMRVGLGNTWSASPPSASAQTSEVASDSGPGRGLHRDFGTDGRWQAEDRIDILEIEIEVPSLPT